MRKRENEGFLGDLASSRRIGRYKPFGIKKRLIGPDLWILASSFFLILIPSIWFVILLLPMYENPWLIVLLGIVFIGSMGFDLYTLVDVGTSDSGIIPKSTHKVNPDYKYYIDPKRAGFERIKLKACKTGNIVRPPRSFHCRKGDSGIEVHDHHCPWTGTCIGRRTHKKFIKFLFATSFHGFAGLTICSYPLYLLWGKPITNMSKLSGVILIAYAIGIMCLLFFFGLYHLSLARKNMTTNEKLRGAYRKKSNPYDYGADKNMYLFNEEYPNTPSSIFDMHKSLIEDEEAFYYSLLSRYGKLVCTRVAKKDSEAIQTEDDAEAVFIDYNNNGEIKMLVLDDQINLSSGENQV